MEVLVRPRRKREKSYEDLNRFHEYWKAKQEVKRVYPGKGLSSSEIRARVRNRSIVPGTDRLSFSEDKRITELQGMSRVDLMRSHANEKPKLEAQKQELQKSARAQKIKEEAVKLAKGKEDGKG